MNGGVQRVDFEAMVEGRQVLEEEGITIYREWTKTQIDDELRDHGVRVDTSTCGHEMLKSLLCEVEISPRIGRGTFVVSEKNAEPNGRLIGGVAAFIAESIGSACGAIASSSKRIAGVELNVNNLHPAYVGQEVTVICKPMKINSSLQTWEIRFEKEVSKEYSSSTTESQGENLREKVLVATARLTLVELNVPVDPPTKPQNPSSKL
ncbi:unnamed protein product [Calypogeia fissa]